MSEKDREKWNARYREEGAPLSPSPFLAQLDGLLPRSGLALDVAGGSGRNAVWLAQRGLSVTVADVSDAGLERAAGAGLDPLRVDFDVDPLPAGPWDVILCSHFLHRPLFAAFAGALSPGGVLVLAHPTLRNLERHDHPGPQFLLGEGELARLVQGLEIVSYSESWVESGMHEARLAARKG
jgi:SAM-dependent methyltransferase